MISVLIAATSPHVVVFDIRTAQFSRTAHFPSPLTPLTHWRRRAPALGPRLVGEFLDELGLCPGVVAAIAMQRGEPSLECAVPGDVVRVAAQSAPAVI
ncbi:MAG TPA: hypothetical protein VGS19_01945 [Streptosporangiaceae bacterium]|nr:hypothetical protein [Streptosporangiaceae bacterium]